MTKYASLDIETTGLLPDKHNVLEVGIVVDDLRDQKPLDELPRYQAYVLPPDSDGYTGDPFALQMNHEILETIANREGRDGRWQGKVKPRFIHPENLAGDIKVWLNHVYGQGERVLFAGKNVASFDIPFLDAQLSGFRESIKRYHRYLDPGMLFFDPNTHSAPPTLAECCEIAGIDDTVTHRAIDDALQVVQLLRHCYPLEAV